jgi:hypothetical protein
MAMSIVSQRIQQCQHKSVYRPIGGRLPRYRGERRLREHHGALLPVDADVDKIWWPELKAWIDEALA